VEPWVPDGKYEGVGIEVWGGLLGKIHRLDVGWYEGVREKLVGKWPVLGGAGKGSAVWSFFSGLDRVYAEL
jgi:hypothetical protein